LHDIKKIHTSSSLTARPPQQRTPAKRQVFRLPNQRFWVEIDSLIVLPVSHHIPGKRIGSMQFIPIFSKSLKPLVIRSAQRSPFRSSRALVATVVPIRMLSTVMDSKVSKALS
jgi:hypothetical protein